MLGILREYVEVAVRAGLRNRLQPVLEKGCCSVADRREAGVEADALCSRSAELDAVVGCGVVRCGEHCGGGVEPAGGEVGFVGRAEADGDDVGSAGSGAFGKSGGEFG